ncbi:putative glutathione-specific gamma-glutamylcyclotransferase 2 [Homarus americanus]|uniref:putative glutathione-specific gamma-glutamylcyclotransferase 2 n=1 Tax=Homarus americanus TaxID=6706 RepID=UPI001C495019|nr:putative glutathione-specific gamma-glutamylcyclotransferase 2 [Homarus americanus]
MPGNRSGLRQLMVCCVMVLAGLSQVKRRKPLGVRLWIPLLASWLPIRRLGCRVHQALREKVLAGQLHPPRGPGKPGRVATLVEEHNGATWGVAYELTGEAALHYLETREVSLGGYATNVVTFFPKDAAVNPFPVLLYIATPSSQEWAGQAPLHEIATQITQCSGPSGHNVEYLLRLAEFMREKVPEGYDEHLASLETLVRLRIKENNMCLKSLMGDGPREPHPQPAVAAAVLHQEPQPAEERRNTFQFSAKLPPKKLRCLNV